MKRIMVWFILIWKKIKKIESTENFSFLINDTFIKYFNGVTLSKYITCSSGMTIGKNELFLKEVFNNTIIEKYNYEIINESKTFEKEVKRNKFGKITETKRLAIENEEMEKVLSINPLEIPNIINLPNSDYKPYNKSTGDEIYSKPNTYVYWKNDGEAVKTFKKTGPWYLHGVGGEKFFFKEGFTWSLISDKIKVRYLPSGYILDSGAPVGNLKQGVNSDELYFIIGWLLTNISTSILKNVINHTKNIQSKDIERLPYPNWVSEKNKSDVISFVKKLIDDKMNGRDIESQYKETLDGFFDL